MWEKHESSDRQARGVAAPRRTKALHPLPALSAAVQQEAGRRRVGGTTPTSSVGVNRPGGSFFLFCGAA